MKPSFVLKSLLLFITISESSDIEPPVLISVLQISETDQKDDVCILKYQLAEEFQDLPTPPWVQKWDNLMFHSFCDNKYDVKVLEDSLIEDIAKLLLFSLASGFSVKSWDRKVLQSHLGGNSVQDMKDKFWKTGQLPRKQSIMAGKTEKKGTGNELLGKRLIVGLGEPKWEDVTEFPAKVSIFKELQADLESKGDVSLYLLAPALCRNKDDNFACLLWDGDAKRIRSLTAAKAIELGIGSRLDDEEVAFKAKDALKRVTYNTVCLSNRANGCIEHGYIEGEDDNT